VASLGTLNKVENQENLGSLGGLLQSTGSGMASISNTITLGLQDEIYYTQTQEGPGLKSIAKGTKKAAVGLTPYEEAKVIFSSNADIGQRLSSVFMAISKTAGLVRMYQTIKTPTNPKPQSLENFQARKWYLKQEKLIPEQVDQNLPIREKGLKAFKRRNDLRTKDREFMADRQEAERLNIKEPNKKLNQIVRKCYKKKGLVGDALWEEIYKSAAKSRETVNLKMTISLIKHFFFFAGGITNAKN
jgi:hypothetical protein